MRQSLIPITLKLIAENGLYRLKERIGRLAPQDKSRPPPLLLEEVFQVILGHIANQAVRTGDDGVCQLAL